MERFGVIRKVYGYDIEAVVTKMENDFHILLTGGCLPHTGAVSIYESGKEVGYLQLPSHKDGIVGTRWAKAISELHHNRVTVVCGIHYDNASSMMLKEIVEQTDEMLQEVMKNLR